MDRRLIFAAAIVLLVVLFEMGALITVRADSMTAGVVTTRAHVGAGSIAAGRAHTVIAEPDGSVYVWGAGARGQLGVGGLGVRLSPTQVPNLGGIVAVSAGAAHTVALSSSGDVYAWGANTFGRLGDGTRKRRDRPIRVPELGAVRMIAAGQAHTLALTADGRVFAWGLNANGQIGNGRKTAVLTPTRIPGLSHVIAIAAGDAHSLAVTRDGRLFAWGRNDFSALGDGTTKDRRSPVLIGLRDVVAVAGGGNHSLALLRSGAVYSWGRGASGELGTGTTRVASTPKLVGGLLATAISAGRHFSGAITTSGLAVTWGANGSGQLGDGTTVRRLRPVAVIGGTGVASLSLGDLHGAAVTLSGDVRTWGEGTLGRLGSGTAADRSTPVEILSEIPDWGAEPGHEPADTQAPLIRAVVSPPLQDGWMTSPVTVSFECDDETAVASCSGPAVVDRDGVTQLTGVAVDTSGNESLATITIHMDLQPPVIAVDAPVNATAIPASDTVVTGSIADAASGIVQARCNGQSSPLVDARFQCAVQLEPGRNDIIVDARDAVGRESTMSITVTRVGVTESLFLTPASRTVGLNEVTRLVLSDQFGSPVPSAAWTTDLVGVVTLSDEDPPVVTAVGVGVATIAADKDGLRAEAVIRVVPELGPGDTRWTLPSVPPLTPMPPLLATQVTPDSPRLFSIDAVDWDKALVRAVSADGEVLWQQHVSGVPFLGDAFGGLVAGVPDEIGDYRGLTRIGGGTASPWRYRSPGILGIPAQAHDGTLYATETVLNGKVEDGVELSDSFAVVLDGATGRLISRTPLPHSLDEFVSDLDGQVLGGVLHCRSYRFEYPADVVGPIVGADGRGYFLTRKYRISKRDSCVEPKGARAARSIEMGIEVVVVSRSSAPKTIAVYSSACEGAPNTTLTCDFVPRAYQLMPDGIGGVLVTWDRATAVVGRGVSVQKSLTRVDAAAALTERAVDGNLSLEMIGQDGLIFTYGNGWTAIDIQSGQSQWAGDLPNLAPAAARPDGGVAAIDVSTGELAIVGASGEVESRQPLGLAWPPMYSEGDWIGLKDDGIAAVAGTFSDATRFSTLDRKTGQQRERTPGLGIWLKTHNVIVPGIQHASIRVTPADQDWLVRNRLRFETCVGGQQCVSLGKDEFGNQFFTIGAGAGSDDTNLQCNGILTKGFNRPNDVGSPPAQPLVRLPSDWSVEPLLVNSLITRAEAFADDLPYHCYPEEHPGLYNSNSFAHGLLHAASVAHSEEPPTKKRIPGWVTPVPQVAFFKP